MIWRLWDDLRDAKNVVRWTWDSLQPDIHGALAVTLVHLRADLTTYANLQAFRAAERMRQITLRFATKAGAADYRAMRLRNGFGARPEIKIWGQDNDTRRTDGLI